MITLVLLGIMLVLDNGHLVSCSDDSTIKAWNLESNECIKTLFGHTSSISSLDQTAKGVLVNGSHDETIKLWNIGSGECIKTLSGHINEICSIKTYSNGLLIS